MTAILLYLFLPLIFCTNDYQLVRVWMRDVSSIGNGGVTDSSLFLSVELNIPQLTSPDWKYAINEIVEKQPHKYMKNDDFHIYGNRHWNQQLFRFFPETGLILSERFPDMALNIVDEYMQLVDKKSIPSNWRWKAKKTVFDSLYELRHSNFEIEHILIEETNTNSNLTGNTNVTVNDIQPQLINNITENIYESENNSPESIKNNLEIETNKEQKFNQNITPKKKSTTIWIFISITVVIIIVILFVKFGCFPRYSSVESSNHDGLRETIGPDVND